jgi:site-specific DNA-adenine methylase
MRYQGGKKRLGKEIAHVLHNYEMTRYGQLSTSYWEPFVGMNGVMKHIISPTGRKRYGSDNNLDVIKLWQACQQGWLPNNELINNIDEEQYNQWKNSTSSSAERAFVGCAYGFGGSYFSSFAPKYDKTNRDYGKGAMKSLAAIVPFVQDVLYNHFSYDEIKIPQTEPRMMIYCDPPYATSKVMNKNFNTFNHDMFWQWVRDNSKYHCIIVSETTAPADFQIIWSSSVQECSNRGKQTKRIEHLFTKKL